MLVYNYSTSIRNGPVTVTDRQNGSVTVTDRQKRFSYRYGSTKNGSVTVTDRRKLFGVILLPKKMIMISNICILLLLSVPSCSCLYSHHHQHLYFNRYQNKPLYSSSSNKNDNDNIGNNNIFNIIQERLNKISNSNNNKQDVYKDENSLMIDYINYKPWIKYKIKNLNIHYKPYQQNWEEKFRKENDDTIYLYSIPKIR